MEIKVAPGGARRQVDRHQCPHSRLPQLKRARSKEAVMKSLGAVETLLTRVRDWWRRRNELGGLDDKELQRIAAELGMSTHTLRGPGSARSGRRAQPLRTDASAGTIESGCRGRGAWCIARSPTHVRMLQ